MSTTRPTAESPDQKDPEDVVAEHRELLERLADTDLRVAEACEHVLEQYDRGETDD